LTRTYSHGGKLFLRLQQQWFLGKFFGLVGEKLNFFGVKIRPSFCPRRLTELEDCVSIGAGLLIMNLVAERES
jgi:hypothetical protein